MAKVHLIIGSTRQGRVAPHIAEWVKTQVAKNPDVELEVIDLKEVDLPFFDAAVPPAYMPDATEHGKAWAEKIGSAERFIFLTSEYNRSMPAALKNAIDFLVSEWKEKPAAIVSYGYIDGGLSAAKHLHDVFDWLKVATVEPIVGIHLKQEMMNEDGTLKDAATDFAGYEESFQTALAELVK